MVTAEEGRLAAAGVATYRIEAETVALCTAARALLALDEAHVAVDAFLDRIHPGDRATTRAVIDAAARGETPAPHVLRVRSEGSLRRVRHVAVADRGAVFGTLVDVGELLSEASDLDAMLSKWAEAFRVAGVGLAVAHGDDFALLDVNGAFVQKFRTSEEALANLPLEHLFTPDARDAALEALGRVDSSRHERFETEMVRADGDVFAALCDVTAATDADGVRHAYVTVLDIQEVKAREQQMRIFREVIDHLPIGVLLARLEAPGDAGTFRFVHVNEYARERSRDTLGDLVGHRIDEVVPDVAESELGRMYLAAVETREPQRVTAHPYGEGQVFDLRAAAVDEDLVAIIYDEVSEREHMIQELERLNTELGRSNSELQDFASVASHDLKAPLRSIIAFAGLLRDELGDALTEEASEQIGFIEASATRLRTLVTDLLDFARVGQRELRSEAVDLEALVGQVRQDLFDVIVAEGARVEAKVDEPLQGDGTMLRQLLQNLVSNAIKFRREDPPHVQITCAAERDHFVVTVEDNGIGVAEEHLAEVFDPFRRLHTDREYAGTGIGLAVCKRIVQRHGGRIWMTSRVGAGSCVTFTLPRAP